MWTIDFNKKVFPYGKYKDRTVEDIIVHDGDADYLNWWSKNVKEYPFTKKALANIDSLTKKQLGFSLKSFAQEGATQSAYGDYHLEDAHY